MPWEKGQSGNPKGRQLIEYPLYRQYPDRGCTFYRECLSCPYSKCIQEMHRRERSKFLSNISETLGERIICVLGDKGQSIRSMAREIKCDHHALCRFIKNPTKARATLLIRVFRFLGIDKPHFIRLWDNQMARDNDGYFSQKRPSNRKDALPRQDRK